MNLWIVFGTFTLLFVACVCYVVPGAFDPEGRGMPHTGLAIGLAALFSHVAAAAGGAIIFRHFFT